MRFETYSDSRQTLFAIIVLLIDDDDKRIIHSHQQFSYLYIRHCKIKFNIYLIYSNRPKNEIKNYSIHIDIYEKISLEYRGSFLSILKFTFLPVHRIALQLYIPGTKDQIENCIDHKCINGRCIQYSNSKDIFCQCQKGWTGKYCTISHKCTCSDDSLCIGILTNNRSLCVCPINKWASQCLLKSMICENNKNLTCFKGGKCIPTDENVISEQKFFCICLKGYSGNRCEIRDSQWILSFDNNIILPEYILVHFIKIIKNAERENGSTYKMIPVNNNSVTIYWSRPFHIVFVKINSKDYYLITTQKIFKSSITIIEKINSLNHCKHIREVLNETIIKFDLICRIKYYHLPCQNISFYLSCFYDENYFCLCYDFVVLLLAILTHIPDPIHRHSIDDNDNDEQRIWCIVTYSSNLQIFNSIINIFHFFIPFLINLISPIIIIKTTTRQRITTQRDRTYRQLLFKQCQQYKHLLIGSVFLVIFSTPRLIISFVSSCMKSNSSNSWIFLYGYFISFVPFILHFIIFVHTV